MEGNNNIHVLYLSRVASYENDELLNKDNKTLVMGFFDNINEVFNQNERGGDTVDYLDAFGIHTPHSFAKQKLTAKQLFTLIEYKDSLKCHYAMPNKLDMANDTANFETIRFGQAILGSGKETQNEPVPAFIGIISANFNGFKDTEKNYDDKIAEIKSKLEEFIQIARSPEPIPENVGEISRNAEIRLFKCTNCSDICVTVRTIRMMDILLVSKAVQICIGERAKAQFSPVWSFVTIPTESFEKPEESDKEKTLQFEMYIKEVVNANSYRSDPVSHNKDEKRINKEAITVDFRVSFKDFSTEKEFLKVIREAEQFENANHEVDHIYRVAGVLGNGNYSIHLPFHEYLELFRFKYLRKAELLNTEDELQDNQPLLKFLLEKVTGRKELNDVNSCENESTVTISYQRIRFCYPKHLYENSNAEEGLSSETRFNKAWLKIAGPGADNTDPIPKGLKKQKWVDKVETLIHQLLQDISVYRNKIASTEYRFREAIYLVNDLVYTYNDLFARNNIHTSVFITQILAVLINTKKFCEDFSEEGMQKFDVKSRVIEITENLRIACLALDRYNHEIVMNSGSNFNAQNYEIQSKVNIEKYVVAYSCFLQKICDSYINEYHNGIESVFPKLYPFVYLDLNKKKIVTYSLFERIKYENTEPQMGSPVMFAIAVPNYRRFANIIRILPQLVHEVSHQFVYTENHEAENKFLLKKGAEYLATSITKGICYSVELTNMTSEEQEMFRDYQKELKKQIAVYLENHILNRVSTEIADTYSEKLRDYIISPYVQHNLLVSEEFELYFPGTKRGGIRYVDWGKFTIMLNKLGSVMALDEFETKNESSLYHSLREMLNAFEMDDEKKIDCARKDFLYHCKPVVTEKIEWMYSQKEDDSKELLNSEDALEKELPNPVGEEMQEILEKELEEIDKYCRIIRRDRIEFSRQVMQDALCAIFNQALEYLEKDMEVLFDKMLFDETLLELMDAIYSCDMPEDLEKARKSAEEYLKEIEPDISNAIWQDWKKVCGQIEAFKTLLRMVEKREKIILLFPGQEEQMINQCIIDALREVNDQFWKNEVTFSEEIRRFQRKVAGKKKQETVLQAVSYLGPDEISEGWFSFSKVHSEICADLGMCAAMGFDAFGYLVFMANLYIEHIETENVPEDQIYQEGEVEFYFRDRRYYEVMHTISENAAEELMQKVMEMLDVLNTALIGKENENSGQEAVAFIYRLEKYKDQIEGMEQILNKLRSDCRMHQYETNTVYCVYNAAHRVMNDLNQVGETLRRYQKWCTNEENDETVTHLIHNLSDYLRYDRVIRQVCRYMMDCGIVDSVKEKNQEEKIELSVVENLYGEKKVFSYSGLYQQILKSRWIKELHKEDGTDICTEIGKFYNECHKNFNYAYSFSKQVEFILQYYSDAHKLYAPVYARMNMEYQLEEISEQWAEAEKWIDAFYSMRIRKE